MKTKIDLRAPKLLSFSIITALFLTVGITSCHKDSGTTIASALMVTNSADASAPQDFYLDDTKVNSTPLAYTQSTGYVTVSGTHTGAFKTSGTTTVNYSFGVTFVPGHYYSIYFTDNNTIASAENDRSTAPQTGKARVRFVNLSSGVTSSVDFGLNGGSKLASGLAYKAFSDYYDVAAASTFSLYASGSSTVLLNIPATILAGNIYTIYISGKTSGTVSYHMTQEN